MPKREEMIDKPKNSKAALRIFFVAIRKYGFPILVSVLLAISSAILGLFIPKILGDMTTIAVESYPEINWVL